MSSPLGVLTHLGRRFAGSLRPGGPGPEVETWARAQLLEGERALWSRLSAPDRRHAVAVARRVEAALGADARRPVLAAALLHDVGKVEAGLGTWGRVAATLAGGLGARGRARRWAGAPGTRGRVGRYLRHADLGAELLTAAGSDGLTVVWTREHHLPPDRWTSDRRLGEALKAADDD